MVWNNYDGDERHTRVMKELAREEWNPPDLFNNTTKEKDDRVFGQFYSSYL